MEQIANINTGDIDLSDYVTQEQLQSALDALGIDIDLSAYATKEELQQAISNIDLSEYATTAYVDNAIANIPTGDGDVIYQIITQSKRRIIRKRLITLFLL